MILKKKSMILIKFKDYHTMPSRYHFLQESHPEGISPHWIPYVCGLKPAAHRTIQRVLKK